MKSFLFASCCALAVSVLPATSAVAQQYCQVSWTSLGWGYCLGGRAVSDCNTTCSGGLHGKFEVVIKQNMDPFCACSCCGY
jgi:hypothetical protein